MARERLTTEVLPACFRSVSRRPGRAADYPFALALYLDSTKPLLVRLRRWDEKRWITHFTRGFRPEQVEIFSREGTDIGWIQVSETAAELHLDQLHLVKSARNRGFGSHLIRELQERARRAGKPLALNVIRGNRALDLYRRLGFRVVGGDEERIRMLWMEPWQSAR